MPVTINGYAGAEPPGNTACTRIHLTSIQGYGGGTGSGIIPNWGSWDFGAGEVGIAYDAEWDMPTSDSPMTYSVVAYGTGLPPGLSLVTLSGNAAKLSGTPTTAGSYSFKLRASNPVGTVDKIFSLTVAPAPSGGGEVSHTFVC